MNKPDSTHLKNSLLTLKDAVVDFATPYVKQAQALPLPKLLGWCIVGALLIAILPLALFLFFAFLVGKAVFGGQPKADNCKAPAQLNHVIVDDPAREPS
jgi:hypothetical protein